MTRNRPAPRGNRILILVTAVLAAAGAAEISWAQDTSGPPQPKAAVVGVLPTKVKASLAPLDHSVPVHIDIPAVNVHATIITVGIGPNDSLGTPPLKNAKVAAWYDGSSAPGEVGPSIIDAHVDSSLMSDYRGAFYYLGLAKPGMEVDVTRTDRTVAVFTIDEVQEALKTQFPTNEVYSQTSYPSLRLITCGGDFDKKTHEYLANTIVFAHLTAERQASTKAG